jgi:transcriptional regulator with XRE-family HTH domain
VSPAFPELVQATQRRRELLRGLAELREKRNKSQTAVAAAMATSQSAIAGLEGAATDAKLSTLDRYAASLGYVIQYQLVAVESATDVPALVVQGS